LLPDEQGMECPDLDFAVEEARLGAREVLAAIGHDQQIVAEAMLVAVDKGRTLQTISLSELLPKWAKGARH
jgi:hypothetical protein